ncbi:MAG: MerR family transcriptional regulator [Calditrichaeota bacterium]|nr:MerR family transcriptional regulator [Calditrichota bacterium]
MGDVLLISDLASRTGLSIHTLNYYLQLGLIKAEGRAPRSGYRLFGEDTLRDLERIIELRRRNTPIREIIARKSDGIL